MALLKKEKPRHLGRGLESLLGPIITNSPEQDAYPAVPPGVHNFPPDKYLQTSLHEIELTAISPNPYQPRSELSQEQLSELAQSIRQNGVLQPIIVRRSGDRFELIAGERRFRAAQLAELKTIPAIVRAASDEQLLELALIENIHRTDLNPIDRAKAYQKYIETFSLTQSEVAERLGENRSVVANYLRLLDLPTEIKQMLIANELTMGHARAVLALPSDELRRKLANRALAGRLSVREVERLVRRYMTGPTHAKPAQAARSAHIVDLERNFSRQLGTRVSIETKKNGYRGRIIIEFNCLEEFDGIAERMGLAVV